MWITKEPHASKEPQKLLISVEYEAHHLYSQYIRKYFKDLTPKQHDQLLALYVLSQRVGFDVGSWFMSKYEKLCLELNHNATLTAQHFVEYVKIPKRFIQNISNIEQRQTIKHIKSMFINYAQIQHTIYSPLTSACVVEMDPIHNIHIIYCYITHLHASIQRITSTTSITPKYKFRIRFVSHKLHDLVLNDENCLKSDRISRGDKKDTFAALQTLIHSVNDTFCANPSLIDIIVLRNKKDSQHDDVLYVHRKALDEKRFALQTYDTLLDHMQYKPKHDGILTFLYTLMPSFTRIHLYYGFIGIQIYREHMLKVLCLLFDDAHEIQANDAFLPAFYSRYSDHEEKKHINDIMTSDKIIYIPKEYTARAIMHAYIKEHFETKEQLFYYLRWRACILSIHRQLKVLCLQNRNVLIFCTDLHRRQNPTELLYIVGTENDKRALKKRKAKIEKWKMSEYFMTASEIETKYGINADILANLCDGLTVKLQAVYHKINMKQLSHTKNKISMEQYAMLPVIKTNKAKFTSNMLGSRSYKISKHDLAAKIKKSEQFVPIVSFNENRDKYFVDLALLVDIGDNVWIVVIFSADSGYHPVGFAVDCVDIENKIRLFKAAMTATEYQSIQNTITQLVIIEHDAALMFEAKDAIIAGLRRENATLRQQIRQQNTEQQNVIISLQRKNDELKEMNNYYFRECMNPNCNIRAHPVHLPFLRQNPVAILIVNENGII